jgi:iron complex outermembrane receptor protein
LTSEFLQSHAINDVVTALQNVSSVAAYTTYGVYQSYVFRGFSDSVMMVDGIRNEGNPEHTLSVSTTYGPGQAFNVIASVRVRSN